ncbi:MAG: hypothetical protein IJO34_06750 [Akkermansia sp.]|nr:hypothetical protein [Akkermansia sp.]
MKIPPYWHSAECNINGRAYRLRGVSWVSEEDARAKWETKTELMRRFLASGCSTAMSEQMRSAWLELDAGEEGRYAVLMPEPVVEQPDAANIITRNRYGVEVLNSTELCFVDVDRIPPRPFDWLRRLLGQDTAPEACLLEKLHRLVGDGDLRGARVYRTSRGWRILALEPGLQPDSHRMQVIFEQLHADELYAHLCAKQQCWRARLTPKPSKVGMPRYPRPACSAAAQSPETQQWIEEYAAASAPYAVCRLIETLGAPLQHPLIELHDTRTRALRPDWPLR